MQLCKYTHIADVIISNSPGITIGIFFIKCLTDVCYLCVRSILLMDEWYWLTHTFYCQWYMVLYIKVNSVFSSSVHLPPILVTSFYCTHCFSDIIYIWQSLLCCKNCVVIFEFLGCICILCFLLLVGLIVYGFAMVFQCMGHIVSQ